MDKLILHGQAYTAYTPTLGLGLGYSTNHCYLSYGCYSDIEADRDHCPIGLLLTTKLMGKKYVCFWYVFLHIYEKILIYVGLYFYI